MFEFLINNWLEALSTVIGIWCVWLLIKENVLTFPLGIMYSITAVVVLVQVNLYADVVLNLAYIAMNAYGWYFWLYGGGERREADQLTVATTSPLLVWQLLAVTLVGALAMGWLFDNYSAADLAYLDSLTTFASFVAMWMTAQKYLSSWVAWFIIDVIQIGLYSYKGLYFYAFLFFVYLVLAVLGWRAWRKHLREPA